MRNASCERRQTEDAILGVVLGCKVIKLEEYNARKMIKVKHLLAPNFLNLFSKSNKNKYSIFLYLFSNKLNKLKFNRKTKINRRCIFSNRNRGVLRPFNISRITFKELVYFGLLPGYKKAVW
jgi:small subunit ribosomal protein S14